MKQISRLALVPFLVFSLSTCTGGQNDSQTAIPSFCPVKLSSELSSPLATGNTPPRAYYQMLDTPYDTSLAITLYACDPDQSSSYTGLYWELVRFPSTGSWDKDLGVYPDGVLTYTPQQGYTGTDSFAYQVLDSDGAISNTAEILITILPNSAPVLATIGPQSVAENSPLVFGVSGSDVDGTSLSYSATPLPSGASFVGTTFTWTPNNAQGGTSGVFADSGQSLGNDWTQSIALGDVDGDGDLDLVDGTEDYVLVYFNQGGAQGATVGVYSDSGQVLGDDSYMIYAIALGDVDGDVDLDMMVTGYYRDEVLFINQGGAQGGTSGVFADSGQTGLDNGETYSIALDDVDGDGDLDMVQGGDNGITVYFNQGWDQGGTEGIFLDSGQSLGSWYIQSIALGDVDGVGGDLDIVAGYSGGDANEVYINQGGAQGGTAGVYSDSGQSLGSNSTWSIALGDVDGDGDLDMVAGNYNQGNVVYFNQGGVQGGTAGVYADSGQSPPDINGTESIALGDVDGDGDLDLVEGNWSQGNVVYFNQGGTQGGTEGVFADSGQSPMGSSDTHSIALGDVDSDGDLDLVAGNDNLQSNLVYFNLSATYQVLFTVSDGSLADTEMVTIMVTN